MPVGDRIKDMRLRSGKSLQEVADAVGVSKAHLWEMENNRSKNPSLDTLQKLATNFKTTVAYIIEEPEVDQSKVDQFFRKNGDKIAKLDDENLKIVEDLLNLITKKE